MLHETFDVERAVIFGEDAGAPMRLDGGSLLEKEGGFFGKFAEGAPCAFGIGAVFDADGFLEVGADGDANHSVAVGDPGAGVDVVALFDGFLAVADVNFNEIAQKGAAADAVHQNMIRIFGEGADEAFGKIEFAARWSCFACTFGIGFDALQFIDNDQVGTIGVAGEHAVFLAAGPLLGEKNAIFLNPLVCGHTLLFHIGEPA